MSIWITIRERALRELTQHPGQTAWAIAKTIHEDPASVSSILKRMVDLGECSRTLSKRGRRLAYYYFTKEAPCVPASTENAAP